MKISPIVNSKHNPMSQFSAGSSPLCCSSFKGAVVNINALSDTHGELLLANNALEEMRNRRQDIFCKQEKGKANVLAICGDWFMDGGRKGYATNPDKPNAEFQLEMLNAFIKEIKNIAGSVTPLFTIGNHEFDADVSLLDNILSKIDADIIASNLDLDNSPGFEKSISGNKIFKKKIVEVDDDKRDDLKHKILFLGVMPVNLITYQRQLNGVSLIDNIDKAQRFVTREDYSQTMELCKDEIAKFKQANPNGIVIFLSHTGVEFADNLAKESDVDIIFDGHEHKEDIRLVNGTPIIPLSQNFKKIANARLTIDDDGKLQSIKLKDFNPTKNTKKGPLLKKYCRIFRQDVKKTYAITSPNPDIKVLDTQNVRLGNNYLANFVTDSILAELKKKDSSIDIFAINASAIRHPLNISDEASISPFDIMNVLAGIKSEDGKIMTTEVTGSELAFMVADNVLFNKDTPQKNPIIHYSGLIFDRTNMLKELEAGKKPEELLNYIIDAETDKPIEADKTYKIANVEKYFNKSTTPEIKALKAKSTYTGYNVQDLFKEHFTSSGGYLTAKCDTRIT